VDAQAQHSSRVHRVSTGSINLVRRRSKQQEDTAAAEGSRLHAVPAHISAVRCKHVVPEGVPLLDLQRINK
jgi:hypothetical protein